MRSCLGIFLLVSAAAANVTDKVITTTTETTTTKAIPEQQRNKRQLIAGNAGLGIPIYFDNFANAQPQPEPIHANKPGQPVQPVALVTPVVGNTANLQPPGFLPAWSQNLPIVGTLITNLPLQSLSNMLGGLNLNQLGNLGNLGQQWPNLGGSKPDTPGSSPTQSCPLTQKLNCRCEPLISLPLRQAETHLVRILKQNVRHNEDGSQELRLVISSGHVLYHRNEKDAIQQQGYFSLPFLTGHYLNIHYSINQTNYTVKADVGSSPPSSDFDI